MKTSHVLPERDKAPEPQSSSYPLTMTEKPLEPENPGASNLRPRQFTAEERLRMQAERAAKVAEWSKLTLRQTFADERWMRAHLSAAGMRFGSTVEPATEGRLRSKLRSAGVLSDRIRAAIGGDLDDFLRLNPGLPLWAAAIAAAWTDT